MKVHHLTFLVLLVVIVFLSVLQALKPATPERTTGPKFVCESQEALAPCQDRYGNPAGTYGRISVAYRNNPDYVGVQ